MEIVQLFQMLHLFVQRLSALTLEHPFVLDVLPCLIQLLMQSMLLNLGRVRNSSVVSFLILNYHKSMEF